MAKKKAKEALLVGSKVKAYVKGQDLRVSGDFLEAANDAVYALLDAAVNRCKQNKRGTMRPQDV